MPSWRAGAQFYRYLYTYDGSCFQCIALLDKRTDADGRAQAEYGCIARDRRPEANSVKCKVLFIGFARSRYLWKVMSDRKHDNVTPLKFRRQTDISVCVLPFQIMR
jgi:hypothetical protein